MSVALIHTWNKRVHSDVWTGPGALLDRRLQCLEVVVDLAGVEDVAIEP
jgi:hypothetical protein